MYTTLPRGEHGTLQCQQPKQEAISSCPASASITSIASFLPVLPCPFATHRCILSYQMELTTQPLHLPCLSRVHSLSILPRPQFCEKFFLKSPTCDSVFSLQRWMPRCHPPSSQTSRGPGCNWARYPLHHPASSVRDPGRCTAVSMPPTAFLTTL